MQERLQKIISRAGIASRRKAEELMQQGEVTVNGKVVTELGSKADAAKDHIKVRGKLLLAGRGEPIYLALNKPRDCVSTTSDPEGRRTVLDLVGRYRSKVYPVGRLDYHSEGLLVLTNDGDFANHLLSAKSSIPKTYQVKITGRPTSSDFAKFRNGIKLDDRMTAPAQIRLLKYGENPWYEIVLTEGRQNQIRRMFKSLGFLVEKLKRVRIGSLALEKLPLGTFRELTPLEVKRLLKPAPQEGEAKPALAGAKARPQGSRGFAKSRPRTNQRSAPRQRNAASERRTTGERNATGPRRATDQRGATGKRDATSQRDTTSQRSAPGQRRATGQRSAPGHRSATNQRDAPSQRRTTGPLSAPGHRSATNQRDTPSQRKTTGQRSATGPRRPTGERNTTGQRSASGRGAATGQRAPANPRNKAERRNPTNQRSSNKKRPARTTNRPA